MRNDLQPGDVLLYRSGSGWLGKILTWGEWSNTPGEALEYCHAGIVLSPACDQGFEMNPPSSHYTVLSREPWDCIDVFRPTVEVSPAILADWAQRNVGTKYPFRKIAQFAAAGFLARLGWTWGARKLATAWGSEDHHLMVCSATVCEMLSESSGERMGWPRPDSDMRPADIPAGRVARV